MADKHLRVSRTALTVTYVVLAALTLAMLVGNELALAQITTSSGSMSGATTLTLSSDELKSVDVTQIETTAQGLALVYPLEGKTAEEVVAIMLPTGTPSYGEAMGVSYDDPITSLEVMARAYPALKEQIRTQEPEVYERWLSLAAAPRGISCEFCCSIGAQAITKDGRDMCGCQHHPALQTVALWLLQNTDYSDAEVLREAYRWKTLFFPRDMLRLGQQIAGGDQAVLADIPGMIGGC